MNETVQPPFKLRNSKWCLVGSLTVIEYPSDKQRLIRLLFMMFLVLHPMESISLNSFGLLEHLAMLPTSTLFHWYPGSCVVLDCIDSWSLHPYLLCWSHIPHCWKSHVTAHMIWTLQPMTTDIIQWAIQTSLHQYEWKISPAANGVTRTLKELGTSKGDYRIKQWFSYIASLFMMGTPLKGKNLFPLGANSFL